MSDTNRTEWPQQLEIIKEKISRTIAVPTRSLSQQRIADFLEVTKGKVRAWEGGQRPSADDLEKISLKLGFSPSWLLLRKGAPERESQSADFGRGVESPDPIVQRLTEAERILRAANASDETIQQVVCEIVRSGGLSAAGNKSSETPLEQLKVGNSR